MTKRRHTAAEIRDRIAALASRRLREGSSLLPGVRETASLLGCAGATVVAALKLLAAEGVVDAVPHRGTRILRAPDVSFPHAPRSSPLPASRSRRLTEALLRDLHSGSLATPHDSLPGLKQLQARYGAGRALLSASLNTLLAQGALQRYGRRYHMRSTLTSTLHVRLVAVGDNRAELGQQTHHQLPLLAAVEDECRERGLSIRVHVLNRRFGRPTLPRADEHELVAAIRGSTVAGCLVWNMFMGPALQRRLQELLSLHAVPVAYLDDGGTQDAEQVAALPKHWQTFSVSQSAHSGQVAARYLVERGHRRMAWIDAYPEADWSRRRLQGVRGACLALLGQPPRVLHARRQPARPQRSPHDQKLFRELQSLAGRLSFAPRSQPFLREYVDEVSNPVERQQHREEMRRILEPMLEEACRDEGLTAWIAPNDSIAVECLSFLRSKRVRVPGHVSLVGFDDSQLAVRQHLTSFCHNPRGLAAAMVNYLLDPTGTRAAWSGTPVIEVPGFMRERRTVAVLRDRATAQAERFMIGTNSRRVGPV